MPASCQEVWQRRKRGFASKRKRCLHSERFKEISVATPRSAPRCLMSIGRWWWWMNMVIIKGGEGVSSKGLSLRRTPIAGLYTASSPVCVCWWRKAVSWKRGWRTKDFAPLQASGAASSSQEPVRQQRFYCPKTGIQAQRAFWLSQNMEMSASRDSKRRDRGIGWSRSAARKTGNVAEEIPSMTWNQGIKSTLLL